MVRKASSRWDRGRRSTAADSWASPYWESREAFLAAAPGIYEAVGDDPVDEWEAEPIVSLRLEEA